MQAQQLQTNNANFIAQLNAQKKAQEKKQKELDKKEEKLNERENRVSLRENDVTKRENKVVNFKNKIENAISAGYEAFFYTITDYYNHDDLRSHEIARNYANDKKMRYKNAKSAFDVQIKAKKFTLATKSLLNAVKTSFKVLNINEFEDDLNELDKLPDEREIDNQDSIKQAQQHVKASNVQTNINTQKQDKTQQKLNDGRLTKPDDIDFDDF